MQPVHWIAERERFAVAGGVKRNLTFCHLEGYLLTCEGALGPNPSYIFFIYLFFFIRETLHKMYE